MSILNLGCGNRPLAGAVNHDRTAHSTHVERVWDLQELPWPETDNTYDGVVARDVLEHICPDLFYGVLDEIHRILRPQGELTVQVPEWGSRNAIIDPTHWRGFDIQSFDFLDPRTRLGGSTWTTERRWHIISSGRVPRSDVNLAFTLTPLK